MKIRYFGHSALMLKSDEFEILIDPFIKDNPHSNFDTENLNPDYILVTHGHGDHLGDTIEIAKRCNSKVIAPFELATYLENKGLEVHPMHIGGSFEFDFGRVKLTRADHGSAVIEGKNIIYAGNPCGFVVDFDGNRIYHAGDTALFSDMKLLGNKKIDYAFLPIGDNFTMGIEDAVVAAELIDPKVVIPIHYKTFGYIMVDENDYVEKLEAKNIKGRILEFDKEYEL